MKKYIKLVLMVPIIFLMTGCFTKEYKRSDIIDYVKKEIGLKKFDVSMQPFKVDEDEAWVVTDKVNDFSFHVTNNYYYTMEHSSNSLTDDYSLNLYLKYKNNIKGIDNINERDIENDEGIDKKNLTCVFNNKSDIDKCIDYMKSIYNYLNKIYDKFDMEFVLYYTKELNAIDKDGDYKENLKKRRENIKYSGANSDGLLTNLYKKDDSYYYIKYFEFGYFNQIPSIMNDMNEQDKELLFTSEDSNIIYSLDSNNKIEKKYDNIISKSGSNISLHGMYILLKDRGFNVVGTPDHFTVYNKQGDKYEFSMEFDDYVFREDFINYYYIKNNEKIRTTDEDTYYFGIYDINKFFGTNFKVVSNKFYSHHFDEEGNYID